MVSRISEPSTVWCTSDRIHEKLGQHIDGCFISLATIHPKIDMPIEAILESHVRFVVSTEKAFSFTHISCHEFFDKKKKCSKTKPPPILWSSPTLPGQIWFLSLLPSKRRRPREVLSVATWRHPASRQHPATTSAKQTHIENERMSPEKGPFERERVVFQASFFRGHVGFRRSIPKKKKTLTRT